MKNVSADTMCFVCLIATQRAQRILVPFIRRGNVITQQAAVWTKTVVQLHERFCRGDYRAEESEIIQAAHLGNYLIEVAAADQGGSPRYHEFDMSKAFVSEQERAGMYDKLMQLVDQGTFE